MRGGISGCFFFQAEDGIRYLVRSRGLGDVYKRQLLWLNNSSGDVIFLTNVEICVSDESNVAHSKSICCLLYTSDAADERSSVDLGGRRIIKKKNYTIIGIAPIYTVHTII